MLFNFNLFALFVYSCNACWPTQQFSHDCHWVEINKYLSIYLFTSEAIGDTTVVIRKSAKPSDPPQNAPLVLKSISSIRKCAGCKKPLSTTIEGYHEEDDKNYCFGRFEAYNFWNKTTQRYQATTSTRHYHLNPVCTKVRQSEGPLQISAGNVQVSHHLRTIIEKRLSYNLI